MPQPKELSRNIELRVQLPGLNSKDWKVQSKGRKFRISNFCQETSNLSHQRGMRIKTIGLLKMMKKLKNKVWTKQFSRIKSYRCQFIKIAKYLIQGRFIFIGITLSKIMSRVFNLKCYFILWFQPKTHSLS